MTQFLSEFIHTAPAFRASVSLLRESENIEKASGYIPTASGAEVLFNFGRQLEPNAVERARLLTGTYGTGKSHLALVLSTLYGGHSRQLEAVKGRLQSRHPGQTEQLEKQLARLEAQCPYLVVMLEGDHEDFDTALVRALRNALERSGHEDIMPATYISAAEERMHELAEDPGAAASLASALEERGYSSSERFIKDLHGGSQKHLEAFRGIHREVCHGADFAADTRLKADETYAAAVKQLRDENLYSGIVVFWDEFGQFMEQIVRDPNLAGAALQRFAEVCNSSGTNALQLYLITHRNLSAYIARAQARGDAAQEWVADFRKITGRFKEFHLETERDELLNLLSTAIEQVNGEVWDNYVTAHESGLEMLTDHAYRARIFPNLRSRELRNTVVEGCFPLHPVTVGLLPLVSQVVAQNERTMFQFLCSEEDSHTLARFIKETPVSPDGERLPLLLPTELWGYFEAATREDEKGKEIAHRLKMAMSKIGISDDNRMQNDVLRLIALLELADAGSSEQQLSANEDMLSFSLDLQDSAKQRLSECLQSMSASGDGRVLLRLQNNTYRLASPASGMDLTRAVEDTIKERQASLNVSSFVADRWGSGNGKSSAKAFLGCDDMLEIDYDLRKPVRNVRVQPIDAQSMGNLGRWTSNLHKSQFGDFLLFVVLAEDDNAIASAVKDAANYSEETAIAFAVPRRPLRGLAACVARIDALETLASSDPKHWGLQGELCDEWGNEYDSATSHLRDILVDVQISAIGRSVSLKLIWQWDQETVNNTSHLRERLGCHIDNAFTATLSINDEIMLPLNKKNDGTANARRSVMDMLIQDKAASRLANVTDNGQRRFVEILVKLELLTLQSKPRLGVSKNIEGAVGQVAQVIRKHTDAARESAQKLSELVTELASVPFGIGYRMQALLFAAILSRELRGGNLRFERVRSGNGPDGPVMSGELLDKAFKDPESYQLRYIDVTEDQYSRVEGLFAALKGIEARPPDRNVLIAETQKAVAQWWSQLPRYCRDADKLCDDEQNLRAVALRDRIIRPLVNYIGDAETVLIDDLSNLIGDKSLSRETMASQFSELLNTVEAGADLARKLALARVADAWGFADDVGDEPQLDAALKNWYAALPEATRGNVFATDARKVQTCISSHGDGRLLDALCKAITGKKPEDSVCSDLDKWGGRLAGARELIETWRPAIHRPDRPEDDETSGAVASGEIRIELAGSMAAAGCEPCNIQRTLGARIVDESELNETAKMMLRMLVSTFVDDTSLDPAQWNSVLVAFIRKAAEKWPG